MPCKLLLTCLAVFISAAIMHPDMSHYQSYNSNSYCGLFDIHSELSSHVIEIFYTEYIISVQYVCRNKQTCFLQGCLSSTAEQIVKNKCHSRRTCTITADEDTFGSFCADVGKYLKVSYVCGKCLQPTITC